LAVPATPSIRLFTLAASKGVAAEVKADPSFMVWPTCFMAA
jgi:hypothetical protein